MIIRINSHWTALILSKVNVQKRNPYPYTSCKNVVNTDLCILTGRSYTRRIHHKPYRSLWVCSGIFISFYQYILYRDSVLKWAEEWQKANLKLLRGAIGAINRHFKLTFTWNILYQWWILLLQTFFFFYDSNFFFRFNRSQIQKIKTSQQICYHIGTPV